MVFGQFRRVMALLVAIAFVIAPLASISVEYGHRVHGGEPNQLAGSTAPLQNGSHGDPQNFSHCGTIACTVFVPPSSPDRAAFRIASSLSLVIQNDATPNPRWLSLDPPIPR